MKREGSAQATSSLNAYARTSISSHETISFSSLSHDIIQTMYFAVIKPEWSALSSIPLCPLPANMVVCLVIVRRW